MKERLYLKDEELEAKRYEILEVLDQKWAVYTDHSKFYSGDKLLIIKKVNSGQMCAFFKGARVVLSEGGIYDLLTCFKLKEIRLPNYFVEDLKEEPYLYEFITTHPRGYYNT